MRIKLFSLLFLFSLNFCFAQVNIDTLAYDSVKKDLQLNEENGMVIMGETHEAKNTFLMEYFIIRDLSEKGYKNIFIEGGRSEAEILNMYLTNGDTAILRYTRAVGENKEFRKFIELLYQLNKDKNIGFVFHGFDFERSTCVNFLFNKWFSGVITKDVGMNKNIELLLSINDNGDRTYKRINENSEAIKNVFENIKSTYGKYEKQYREILKENYSAFESVIFNPSYFRTTADKQRDKYMVESMLSYKDQIGLNRSIIITGTFHIINKERFIPLLLNKTNQEYVTTVFIPVYKNCTMLTDHPYKFNSEFSLMHCMKDQPKQPVVTFYKNNDRLVPAEKKNVYTTVLIGFYEQ